MINAVIFHPSNRGPSGNSSFQQAINMGCEQKQRQFAIRRNNFQKNFNTFASKQALSISSISGSSNARNTQVNLKNVNPTLKKIFKDPIPNVHLEEG